MKRIKAVSVIASLMLLSATVHANQQALAGGCPQPCPCEGQGDQGPQPASNGGAGPGPGHNGSPTLGTATELSSIHISVNFGVPATEDLYTVSQFTIYTEKPTPTMFSPQIVQYRNFLLDRISHNLINQNYKDSLGIPYVQRKSVASIVQAASAEAAGTAGNPIGDNFTGGYSSNSLSENMSANMTHQVRMIGPNREAMYFNFYKDDPVGVMSGKTDYLGYRLMMVNQSGQPVTSHPYFYDLYIGYGNFVRYTVTDGMPHSFHSASGRILRPSDPSVGLDAVYESDGTIRQIWSLADGLADVVVTEAGVSFEIRFYPPSQVGNKTDGVYQFSGEPKMVLRIEKPVGGSNADVLVTRTVGGTAYQTSYRYSYSSEGWAMTTPGELAIESQTNVLGNSGKTRTETKVVKTPDGKIAQKTQKLYQTFDFGERIISYSLDPDGLNLQTTFSYYTDSSSGKSYGRKATENLADGSWKTYRYNDDGWESQILSPWLNSEFNSPANKAKALNLSYEPLDSRDTLVPADKRPRTVETKILGTTVRKVFKAYYFENDSYVEIEEIATKPNAAWGDSTNLRTVWNYYPKGSSSSASAGRLKKVTYPDGTTESYTYEYGNLQQAADGSYAFTAGNGNAVREYVTQGTTAHPEGIAGRTTREERIFDVRGNMVYNATQICTGTSSFTTTDWTRYTYDEEHKLLSSLKSNGELKENTWTCCKLASETMPDGTRYAYVYDAMLRPISKTKEGTGKSPDLVTTYTYDAMGRIVSETNTAGDLSETKSTEYNLAGMMTKTTDKYGRITTFEYQKAVNKGSSRHGMTVSATLPNGATRSLSNYCDTQEKSLTGTASVPEYYSYTVNADGSVLKKTLTGSADSARWKQSATGMNGELISTAASGYNGDIVETRNYNSRGQLVKVSKTGSAPILVEYDELGEWSRAGIDVDNNGTLDVASNDRIVEREQAYLSDNGYWKSVTLKTYAVSGNGTATVYSVEKERLSGFAAGVSAEMKHTDVYGNVTTTLIALDRANKKKIKNITHPDSTISEEQVTVNGLNMSERTTSNLTTTMSYDGLERLIAVTEPRIGTRTISYHTRGWLSSVTNAAGNVVEFGFDETSGRLNWIKNPLGKYTRYAYNMRNQIVRIWGEAEYPLEFTYNQYGEQTRLQTYRSGDFSGAVWPELNVSGDMTTWVYDAASGNVTAKIDAKGKETQYTYTTDGKLVTRKWARLINQQPLITTYSYDAATGNLTKVDYSDDTPDITYTYNRLGKLATVQDAAGTRAFAYNAGFDRISETIDGIYNKVLTYNYASEGVKGRYLGFALDNLANSTYSYDNYGRINQITGFGGTFDYSRVPGSELIENLIRPNGVNTAWSYEANRDLVTQVANGSVSTYGYANDALGRRTSMSRGGSVFTVPDILTYGYNDRSEVISAQSNVDENYAYSYSFDPIGNRLNSSLAGADWTYTTNNLNQYTQLVKGTDTWDPAYDDDGNMLTRMGWTQVWNGENRLIETSRGDTRLTFAYDYMGRRVEKKVFTGEVLTRHLRFVYNEYKLIEELDALNNNSTLRRYTWQPNDVGLDVPLSAFDLAENKTYFYHTDANKNVTELTDCEGAVVAHYEYSPFGMVTKLSGDYAATNPFRFSSEYYDSETGLVYYNYRYYDPQLGRWLSRDPIEEDGGWNLYEMSWNSIINLWDNLGLDSMNVSDGRRTFGGAGHSLTRDLTNMIDSMLDAMLNVPTSIGDLVSSLCKGSGLPPEIGDVVDQANDLDPIGLLKDKTLNEALDTAKAVTNATASEAEADKKEYNQRRTNDHDLGGLR